VCALVYGIYPLQAKYPRIMRLVRSASPGWLQCGDKIFICVSQERI